MRGSIRERSRKGNEMAEQSLISTTINIFASPGEAFAAIRERPRPIFPLILTIVGLAVVVVLYLNRVDLGWYVEQQLRASGAAGQLTEQQIVEAADRAAGSPGFIAGVGVIAQSLVIVAIYLLFSLYLWILSSIAKHGIRFLQAFGLLCWSALPGLLGFLASIVNLLANDVTFLPRHLVNPLSFGALFGIDAEQAAATGAAGQAMLGLDITFVWSALLLVLGYQAWSKKPLGVAAAIVLAPYVLLIGLGVWSAMR